MSETQIYEVHVLKAKAQAVFDAVQSKLAEAKAAGNIISASYVRRTEDKGEI